MPSPSIPQEHQAACALTKRLGEALWGPEPDVAGASQMQTIWAGPLPVQMAAHLHDLVARGGVQKDTIYTCTC